jgi:hypothetical protein
LTACWPSHNQKIAADEPLNFAVRIDLAHLINDIPLLSSMIPIPAIRGLTKQFIIFMVRAQKVEKSARRCH